MSMPRRLARLEYDTVGQASDRIQREIKGGLRDPELIDSMITEMEGLLLMNENDIMRWSN